MAPAPALLTDLATASTFLTVLEIIEGAKVKLRRTKRLQIESIVLVVVLYSMTLLRNLHESERASLQLKETPLAGDYVACPFGSLLVDLAK